MTSRHRASICRAVSKIENHKQSPRAFNRHYASIAAKATIKYIIISAAWSNEEIGYCLLAASSLGGKCTSHKAKSHIADAARKRSNMLDWLPQLRAVFLKGVVGGDISPSKAYLQNQSRSIEIFIALHYAMSNETWLVRRDVLYLW